MDDSWAAVPDRQGACSYDEPMALRPTAAFFDLDKTIIAKSSTLAFSRSFQAGGLISRRAMLRSAYAQFVYLVGGADHDQMEKMRQFMSQLCAGWDVATVREIVADTLHNIVDPLVYDEAVSPDRGAPARRPRHRHRLHVRGRGGRADRRDARRGPRDRHPHGDRGRQVHRRHRVLRVRRGEGRARSATSPATYGYDLAGCYAYSDSVTDVHMLEVVGHPHAVNPDRELRKIAASRGWPVLVFTKPVALRSRRAAAPCQAHLGGARGRRRRRRRRRALGQRPAPSPRCLTAPR